MISPAGAPAAPTWTAPVRLAAGNSPSIAVNPAGDALVGFSAFTLTQVISRPRGAAWTEPFKLAEGGSPPSVALDESGDAFAVFTKGQWPSQHFQASLRTGPGGEWQEPVTVSPAPETSGGEVAVNARGDAVVAFTNWSGHGYVVGGAMRPAASGRWQQVVDLSDPNGNAPFGAAVAVDPAGAAAALWIHTGPVAENPVVEASVRTADGPWSARAALGGPYRDVSGMDVKFDPAGNAVAAWVGNVGPDGDAVFASQRPVGGGWSPPTILAPAAGGFRIRDLALTVGMAGGAVAMWDEITQGVRAASLPAASGKWQPPVPLTASSVYVVDAGLAADRAGNAVAVWAEGFPHSELRAALRPAASGRWEPATTIASVDYGSEVSVASDDHGGALAVWQQLTTDSSVHASELRPGGPVLAQLTTPHAGAAGVPVTFAVTPAAWGSPLAGEPLWSFGDGASARGGRVLHTYRRRGTFTVSVSQSDAAGTTSTSSSTIVVGTPTLVSRRAPTIAGRPQVGATLTCRRGQWRGTQPIRFRYAWLRNGARVGGGAARYRVGPRDAGASISCRVTATNGALTRSATSRSVRIHSR